MIDPTMPPAVTVAFPTGVLFDVMMRGGPLPARYEPLGEAMVDRCLGEY